MNLRGLHVLCLSATAAAFAAGVPVPARAQSTPYWLDAITIIATKTEERWIDTLAAVSTVREEQIRQLQPTRPADLLFGVPGVAVQERADDPATAINIRGLQDFGRVAVTIDGARQNFQRTGHNADGVFYLEPETIGGVDVVRGPVANIYGSGAIGGVVSFRTKDVEDLLRPGEKWAIEAFGLGSTNVGGVGSLFGAVRVNPNVDLFVGGTFRDQGNYKDANGHVIPNTASDTWTGTAKATLRPADGHQIKLGFTNYDSKFVSGQPFFFNFGPPFGVLEAISIFDTHVQNRIANARWTYAKPEDRVFNWDANVYWTQTVTDQTKINGLGTALGGEGNVGDRRNFTIDTLGFDLNNTSRFDTGPLRHALTYGVDGFKDEVTTVGFGTFFTPSGERTVGGGFVQLKSNYSSWLEVIGALRYDTYRLEGGGVQTEGDRLSPKITVGVTPFTGFQPYVTYAEGYRAPAVTEALVTGAHPIFPQFPFLSNPALRPEVGKTKEAGINLKYDNVFMPGATFRAKANVYRNDVSDFIDLVTLPNGAPGAGGFTCTTAPFFFNPFGPPSPGFCEQYQNIAAARLDGVEFESMYDTGAWFAGLAGSHVKGRNLNTGAPLAKIPPDSITATVGARFLERRLTVAVRWQAVAAKNLSDIPAGAPTGPGAPPPVFPPTAAYNLVNVYLGYQINENALASLSVENLLNEQYTRYMTVFPNELTRSITGFPQPGITVKGSLRVRFAGS